jgi:DNA polymerase III beta subunit
MKLQLNRKIFSKIVSKSIGFIDDNAISDIFNNFLIEVVNDNQIAITATDGNAHTGVVSYMNFELMEGAKSFLVKAKKLDSILRLLDDEFVDLELNEKGTLLIKSGKLEYKVPSSSISEYIDHPEIKGQSFELNVGKFLFLIKKVWFSISSDNSKNKLRAGYLKYKDGKILMVGTDSFQLAYSEVYEENDLSEFLSKGILIAKDDLGRLRKILETEDLNSNIKMIIQDNTISIHLKNREEGVKTEVWLRLLGSDYIAYESIFRDKAKQVIVNKKMLQELLKKASPAISKETPLIKLSISKNKILIETNDDSSRFSGETECAYDAESMLIGLSNRYLSDMLSMIDSEFVVIDLLSDDNVVMIYRHIENNERKEDRNYFYILMPMDVD